MYDNKKMITLQRVQLPSTQDIKSDMLYSDTIDNIKSEVPSNLPDPSIIPPYFHDPYQDDDDDDDDQSMTDSGSESGDSKEYSENKRKRPGRKKGQSKYTIELFFFDTCCIG